MRGVTWLFLAGLAVCAAVPAQAKGVTEAQLRSHIEVLASDEFEGRKPGTEGEAKTVKYISEAWAKAGLKPAATNGGWVEPVGLVQRGAGTAKVAYTAQERNVRVASEEIVLIGRDAEYSAKDLPVFFAGYGVQADGSAPDGVSGKVVFLLFEDPENVPKEVRSSATRRDAMLAAGATGVIFIADAQGSWPVLRRQYLSRPIRRADGEKRAEMEGAVSSEYVVALVTAAGRDWDKLRKSAKTEGYAGEALGVDAQVALTTEIRNFDSANIIGKIPGRKQGSGAVVYMGHWDHLGICAPEDAPDRICNGAVDNASGIAVLTEVARALAKKRHDRDIYFIATTAEESGLIGAYAYADKPVFPLNEIVLALNVDTIAIAPRGAKVAIIGRGTSKLDNAVEAVARKARRAIESSTEANAFIQRQDGWALTQKGVPSLMVGGSFADLDKMQKFLGSDYHGPEDELNAKTELGGAAEDADLHIALGRHFADAKKYKWNKAGEWRADCLHGPPRIARFRVAHERHSPRPDI